MSTFNAKLLDKLGIKYHVTVYHPQYMSVGKATTFIEALEEFIKNSEYEVQNTNDIFLKKICEDYKNFKKERLNEIGVQYQNKQP